jgi:ABC-type Mn2+/Zn2+ transport system permease subunit
MIDALTAPFHYDFMQRAFVTALLVGGLCSTLGTFVVLRKLAFIGDGVAHASFAGIVIAYIRGFNFELGAAAVAVLTALGIGYVNQRGRVSLDTAIGVLFTGVFALGVFLMSRVRTSTIDLQDFLFGNILGVETSDLWIDLGLSAIVFLAVAWTFRPLVFTAFDPTVARASGLPVVFLDYMLLVLLALTIVISLESIGIILVAALLVTPAAAAAQVTRRFVPMLLTSTVIGVGSCICGLYISYYLGAASGATIVLVATAAFFVLLAVSRQRSRAATAGAAAASSVSSVS